MTFSLLTRIFSRWPRTGACVASMLVLVAIGLIAIFACVSACYYLGRLCVFPERDPAARDYFVEHTRTCIEGKCRDNAPPVVVGPVDKAHSWSSEPVEWMTRDEAIREVAKCEGP